MSAIEDLTALVESLPNASLLTDVMKQSALDGALIPDPTGVWPGNAGYVTTYDVYFAAVSLLGFLQAQPVVRQSSSEGTSVAVDAPNWSGLVAWYRSMSPIARATSNDLLGVISIPGGSHVHHVDMNGAVGDVDDNVDTDLD